MLAHKAGSTDLPVGAQKWNFSNSSCSDGGEGNYRTLNLHLGAEEPGEFCCNSGQCIDSALVCDDVKNCDGREDEINCVHLLPNKDYRTDKARCQKFLDVLKLNKAGKRPTVAKESFKRF